MMSNFQILIDQIVKTTVGFQQYTAKSIDKFLTFRNWLIGAYIMEYEQNGADKAEYGSKLEENIAKRLNTKGLSTRNLKLFKQFYNTYPQIMQTVSALFETSNIETMQTVSALLSKHKDVEYHISPELLINNLSFSHFVELLKVGDENKRLFYEVQSIQNTWSVRELKRQINTLAYERSVNAKKPELILTALNKNAEQLSPSSLIKTPYVFDFLMLPDAVLASESKFEAALIADLRNFMLELGHGFCFEAQQKRIIIGGEYYFIDLVFYHRILKCHILIELKVDEFSHQHAGQLNTYLQYYNKNIKTETDNPPIGILLCTNKNQELIEYALGGMDENLFVSQYQTSLPSKEQLQAFLQNEKSKIKDKGIK